MTVLVKICGITNLADAELAVDAGADLLGFIFTPKSPRCVTPETARAIIAALHLGTKPTPTAAGRMGPATIGVFVNATLDEIRSTMARAGLDYAQLHGDEPPSALAQLDGRAYKALRPPSPEEAQHQAQLFTPYPQPPVPSLLLDAYTPHAYGGTGQVGDWDIAAQVAAGCPRLMLAGGLTPDNVATAIAAVRPWAVDVSSGVEARPRFKDEGKLRAFVAAVHTQP